MITRDYKTEKMRDYTNEKLAFWYTMLTLVTC